MQGIQWANSKFRTHDGTSTQNVFNELLSSLDQLTAEVKSGLDPENDRHFRRKMRLTVTVARGVHRSGRLSLAKAKNFNDYPKPKHSIIQIDRLCLRVPLWWDAPTFNTLMKNLSQSWY